MNAKDFIAHYGTEKAREVAEAAGTNYAYFSQIAHGHRRPSFELACALAEASGGELEVLSLLSGKKKKGIAA